MSDFKSTNAVLNSRQGHNLDRSGLCDDYERTRDYGRNIIEILLYISIGCRVFGHQLGVLKISGLSGAIILFSGIACFVAMLVRKEQFSISVYFVVIINILANITDLILVGLLNRELLFWICNLLMASYVIKDKNAIIRFSIFVSLCVFGALFIDAVYKKDAQDVFRLQLSGDRAGSMFNNANQLAKLTTTTATILLFQSLGKNIYQKVLLAVFAIALSSVALFTLSRQGLVLLLIGLFFYFVASMFQKRRRIEVFLIAIAALSLITFAHEHVMRIFTGFKFRFSQPSGRTDYWLTASSDLLDTFFTGYGSLDAYTSFGILPHNTFLWMHYAFGGMCALIYLTWIIYLFCRSVSFVTTRGTPWIARIETMTLFAMFFAAQQTTHFAPGNYAFVLCVAIMERNFSIYKGSLHEGKF